MRNIGVFINLINLFRCLLYSNDSRHAFFTVLFISVIISLFCNTDIDIEVYFGFLASHAGFCLAALSIIITGNAYKIINQPIKKEKHCECMSNKYKGLSNGNIIDDITSTIAFGIIIPLIGILLYFFKSMCPYISSQVKAFFILFTVLWGLHIILHIFSLRFAFSEK